ncbi:response regulator [Peptostreptococcus russellii]|uniref:response regulator n=1 Tax=Peptostreptococcus russellii TaxID=215200 RepID=UPI0026F2E547|nr:response regulator transcription factor [Peptostreptococcus russellii]
MNVEEKILIIEDDPQIRKFISYVVTKEEFKSVTADTAQKGMSILVSDRINLIILDLGLPDYDGIDIIKKVREWSDIPIIVVSARDQDRDKVTALDYGADDYLTKPFSATELLARIRVAIRHFRREYKLSIKKKYSVGDLSIDFEKRLVYLHSNELHLTPMEYNLLALLFRNMGKVLTTQYIINEIYGKGYGNDTRALRSLMAGLRRKIEKVTAKPRYIITEIGVGYRLVDE